MEISEAKERLRNLEMEIYNMIAAFEEETGLGVDDIFLAQEGPTISENGVSPAVVGVVITCSLEV